MNTRDSTNCGRGTVFLRRVSTSDFYKEPFLVEKEKEKQKPKIAEKKADVAPKKVTPPNTKPATKPKTHQKTTPPVTKKSDEKPAVNDTATKLVIAPADTLKHAEVKPPKPASTPPIFLTRENELVKTITTDASEVVINIYDNGTVDNDTISVYLDKKLVLHKQRLTEKPLTLKFKLDESADYHELVMVAENLGEIPPNTSLMVVNAGDKQYEVRITSTEQKNAVVIFKHEKGR
jgi:hypothetical protein